jgi:hypothetical protein
MVDIVAVLPQMEFLLTSFRARILEAEARHTGPGEWDSIHDALNSLNDSMRSVLPDEPARESADTMRRLTDWFNYYGVLSRRITDNRNRADSFLGQFVAAGDKLATGPVGDLAKGLGISTVMIVVGVIVILFLFK